MKTKETSICRKCGGNGKPSKGIMNFHNIQRVVLNNRNDAKEFETKLLDCIKCESCGHSWIPETSTREQALAWFNSKSSLEKTRLCDTNTKIVGKARRYETLTGREIEEIWLKETKHGKQVQTVNESMKPNQKQFSLEPEKYQVVDFEPKKNQKQFKQFDESLFRAYIDKFSDEDKLKMLGLLCRTNINGFYHNLTITKAE